MMLRTKRGRALARRHRMLGLEPLVALLRRGGALGHERVLDVCAEAVHGRAAGLVCVCGLLGGSAFEILGSWVWWWTRRGEWVVGSGIVEVGLWDYGVGFMVGNVKSEL